MKHLNKPFRGRYCDYEDIAIVPVKSKGVIGHISFVVKCTLNKQVEGDWCPDFTEIPAQNDLSSIKTLSEIDPAEWYLVTGQDLTETISPENVEAQRQLFFEMYPHYRE